MPTVRIIGGALRRRRIQTPAGTETTRPYPERVREAVFNLLRGHTEGEAVVDVFCGTGSMGIEALSRGASRCVFYEKDRGVARLLKENLAELGLEDRADVVMGDALGVSAIARAPRPVHLVFFDPPYRMVTDPATRQRVFAQFGRFVQLLDETGFAALRTPCPLRDRPTVFEPAEGAEDVTEAYEAGADVLVREGEVLERGQPISLHIDGAIGPETHEYGSTAVHLYVRDPEWSGP